MQLCFCSSDAGCTHTSLSHWAEAYSTPPRDSGDSEAALHLQSANKNPKSSMSHFQLVQAQFVPETDFISWNVKCHSLASQPPASMQSWQSSTLPLVLEDKGSRQGVLVCNTVMHFAKTTGSVLETTDSNAGSSKCKDCIAWKTYSVGKVENLYKANKLPWGTLICRSLSISALVILEK